MASDGFFLRAQEGYALRLHAFKKPLQPFRPLRCDDHNGQLIGVAVKNYA
jgi:hypothetical protein